MIVVPRTLLQRNRETLQIRRSMRGYNAVSDYQRAVVGEYVALSNDKVSHTLSARYDESEGEIVEEEDGRT